MATSPRIAPMLATPGDVTKAGAARRGAAFAYEFKLDGQRSMVVVDGRGVRLSSRNGSSITRTYPEIVDGLRSALAGHSAVLDGESVALDDTGRPSFELLQRRMHVQRPGKPLLRDVPAALFLFDVLALDGRDVTTRPYVERRALLEDLGISVARVAVAPAWTTADGVDGAAMLELAGKTGMEGVVAKRLLSRYRPGERSPDWIKQPLRAVATVVVCGWVGDDTHLEALLLGAPHPRGGLRYIGHVCTGFSVAGRRQLLGQLIKLEQPGPPFDSPTPPRSSTDRRWLQPVLVGEVHYREFTHRLRHPSWRGLRTDLEVSQAEWPR